MPAQRLAHKVGKPGLQFLHGAGHAPGLERFDQSVHGQADRLDTVQGLVRREDKAIREDGVVAEGSGVRGLGVRWHSQKY